MYISRYQTTVPQPFYSFIVTSVTVIALILLPLYAGAQSESEERVVATPTTPGQAEGQCVDSTGVSYENGTLSAQFGRLDLIAAVGDVVSTPVTLTNQSAEIYVPDASLIALIFDERALSLAMPVAPVDWFVVSDNVTVKPSSAETFNLKWDIPDYLAAGTYRIVLYHGQWSMADVLARGMIEQQGIGSLSVDVTGTMIRPSVVDPLSVQVIGDGLSPALVQFSVTNHFTEQAIRGDVSWSLYSGNASFPSRLLAEGSEAIKLTSGASREYEITIPESELDVRLLLITVTTDAPEQLLIPVYLSPEGISLLYKEPQVTFVGVQGDQYVVCAATGNQGDYIETADANPVTLALQNELRELIKVERAVAATGMSNLRLMAPLGQIAAGTETILLTQGEMVYDQVSGGICEAGLCQARAMIDDTYSEASGNEKPFNQSFLFYLAVVLTAALLGYVMLRRLPV